MPPRTNQYLRSHPGVDPIDYIIAATAQALEADLLTTNLKHFPMFPERLPLLILRCG